LRKQRLLDVTCLVFIDESATNTKMTRLMGRGPQGDRVIGSVPGGRWETITLVAGLTQRGIIAPLTFKGSLDGPTFVGYIEECLAPTLKRGQIVILDNLPAHRAPGVQEAIEAAGATLVYLPKYSPELNPIEQAFSKIKALLRKAAERSVKTLVRRIGSILRSINKQECMNYFRNSGYASK
jgi:transposase